MTFEESQVELSIQAEDEIGSDQDEVPSRFFRATLSVEGGINISVYLPVPIQRPEPCGSHNGLNDTRAGLPCGNRFPSRKKCSTQIVAGYDRLRNPLLFLYG